MDVQMGDGFLTIMNKRSEINQNKTCNLGHRHQDEVRGARREQGLTSSYASEDGNCPIGCIP